MAETIISPGVFTRENDISFIQPAPVAAGAAIIGPAVKGPVQIPTLVTSYNDYVRKFGTTFESGSNSYEYLTSIAVKNYFQQGGNSVLVSRVVSGSFTRATSSNITNTQTSTGNEFATGSVELLAAFADNQEARIVYSGTTYRFVGSGNPLPDDDTDGNVYFFSTGSTAAGTVTNLVSEINTAAALSSIVGATADSATLILSASSAGTDFNGLLFQTSSATDASTFSSVITLAGGTNTTTATTSSFELETLGKGAIYNNSTAASVAALQNSDSSLVSGSSDNLRFEISNVNLSLGTFTLSVRRGDDSLKNKIILYRR